MTSFHVSDVQYEKPTTLESACVRLAERNRSGCSTVLLCGGTDWVVEQQLAVAVKASELLVLDISRLHELRGIRLVDDTLRIGAATTYWEIQQSEAISVHCPLLVWMSKDIGAVQIQTRGTLGGNLATGSPAADGVAALAALDAVVVLQSADGFRRMAMKQFQTGYKRSVRRADEIIVAFEVAVRKQAHFYWRKVGNRRAQAISKVALAGVSRIENGWMTHVGLGMASVAPTTALLSNTRKYLMSTLVEKIQKSDLEQAVLSDIAPIDDIRSTREYRTHCALALVRDYLHHCSLPGC